MPDNPRRARSDDIQAIARCAEILRLFAEVDEGLRIQDISGQTGLQRTTVYRYVASMTSSGMLFRAQDGTYTLGRLLLGIGRMALLDENVVMAADGFMLPLREEVGETAVLSVWGGLAPVVVRVHVHERRPAHVSLTVGASLPVTTSQSQIFLAFAKDRVMAAQLLQQLPAPTREELVERIRQTRQTGLATNANVAAASGIGALSTGVFGRDGELLAALALVGTLPSIRTDLEGHHAQALLKSGRSFSEYLGYSDDYPPAPKTRHRSAEGSPGHSTAVSAQSAPGAGHDV